MSVVRDVFRTLVNGYNGIRLSSGQLLQSTTNKTDGLPSLVWRVTGWKSDLWQEPFIYRVQWDIPAVLTVQSESSNPDALLVALDDVDSWSSFIYGLPVDKGGNVLPNGSPAYERFVKENGAPLYLADRFAGPYIARVNIPQGSGDNSYSIAELTFHLEFTVDATPKAKAVATFFILGVQPLDLTKSQIADAGDNPFTYPLVADVDLKAQGAYNRPETLPEGASFPPLVRNIPAVDGTANPVKEVTVSPATFALSVGTPTQQLSAIAFHDDGSSEIPAFIWTSSDATVATVDTSGLVTRVAAGSATISASFGGSTGSSSATVS